MAYTTIDNPELYFQTKLYTGTGSSNAVTLDGSENMRPDWVWIKNRDSGSLGSQLHDVIRGTTKRLFSNSTDAEETDANGLTAFNSNGFTVGSNVGVNQSSSNMVAWNWSAGGSASSNSNGSITSSVSASTDAGFSIISYTGVGGTSNTLGHGLGVKPKMFIVKCRSHAGEYWGTWIDTDGDGTSNYRLSLNVTDAAYGNDPITFSNSTITLPSSANTQWDGSGRTYIGYCFSEKKGYSKIGSYVGNDNANGTFVYTGFAPAWVMIKRTNSVNNWIILDRKRNPINPSDERIFADQTTAASTANTMVDFLSNGFKPRSTYGGINGASDNFVYMAFAESPFVNSAGAVPTNAR